MRQAVDRHHLAELRLIAVAVAAAVFPGGEGILPQPFFVEYVKNTVKKVMLSAVAGDGQKEKLALQAAPALGLSVVTLS
ncbi:TPA: hypothetical protein M4K80_003752 [Salmonella enterica]|nr:hypothetical protein [Salmonella enterica]